MPKSTTKSSKKSKFLKKLLFALTSVLLIAIPAYPKFPLFFLEGERVAIRLDDILIALSFLVFLCLDYQDRFRTLRSPFARLVYFFFFALGLSTLNSFLIGHDTPDFLIALLHFLRRLEYFTIFLIIKKSLDLGKPKSELVWATLFSLFLVSLYGLGQKFLAWPVISTMNEEFSKGLLLQMSVWTRINSTFAGHYDLAVYLSLILSFLPAFIINQKKKILKIPLLLIWLLSFYILILTASRVSFIAAFLGTALSLFLSQRYFWIFPLILVNVIGVLLSPDLNQRLLATYNLDLQKTMPQIENFISQKLAFLKPQTLSPTPAPLAQVPTPAPDSETPAPVFTPTPVRRSATSSADIIWPKEDIAATAQRSGDIRFKVEWPRALNALKKNPLLGTGPSSITLATDNDYLRTLGESGILGFFSWILPFLYLTKRSLPFLFKKKKTASDHLVVGLFAVLIVMFLNATLIDVFEASKIAYFFWALVALFAYTLEKKDAQT
jgi:hypothetical protein